MPPTKKTPDTPTIDPVARNIAILKAEPWLPEIGERRTAQLITVRKQADDFGGHIVLVLESPAGSEPDYGIFAYHVFSALEMENLNGIKPSRGSMLTIYNGGKRETNASKRTWEAYRREVKALLDAGKNDEASNVAVPERRFYHDNLIMSGDGTDIDDTEFSWGEVEDSSRH